MTKKQVSSRSGKKKSSSKKTTAAAKKRATSKTSRSSAKSTAKTSTRKSARKTSGTKKTAAKTASSATARKKRVTKSTAKKATAKKAATKKTAAKKTQKKSSNTATPVVAKKATTASSSTTTKRKRGAAAASKKTIKRGSNRTVISVKRVASSTDSTSSAGARPTLSSIIPTPTRDVLKPFRDAAKQTKRMQKEKVKANKARGDFLAKQSRKGKKYKIDLRVHTPASLGYFTTGGVDPAPAMVRLAGVKGIDIIGVTDYYNVAYIDEIQTHAASTAITVLPGFDMRCRVGDCTSITAIALFPSTHCAADIKRVLDSLEVPESEYGNPDYIVTADFESVIACIEESGGIVIPSRVDKTPYRRLAIPALVERFGFHAFDLVHRDNPEYFRENWPSGGFTFFSFSNANALGQIGCRTATVKLSTPGFEGLRELVRRRTEDLAA